MLIFSCVVRLFLWLVSFLGAPMPESLHSMRFSSSNAIKRLFSAFNLELSFWSFINSKLILVTAFYSTTDQQDFEGGLKNHNPLNQLQSGKWARFFWCFLCSESSKLKVCWFFCYNVFQWNMRESTYTGDTPRACFLLVKPNIFLDSSVGRAPDC